MVYLIHIKYVTFNFHKYLRYVVFANNINLITGWRTAKGTFYVVKSKRKPHLIDTLILCKIILVLIAYKALQGCIFENLIF